jgi:phage gp46-like protein
MTERPVDASLLPREGAQESDLALLLGDLEHETTMRTAILLSLFSDARATPDELRNHGGDDPRGACIDALSPVEGDRFGSKLWLLFREKQIPETLNRAKRYCEDALEWLREDGIARLVEVVTAWIGQGRMSITITITKPDDVTDRFAFVWSQAA